MNILKKLPKIGMRTIKTVIATMTAIVLSNLLGFESPFYATLTAFFCLQSSIVESSEVAVKRSIGTIIGGVFSLVYLVFMPENVYVVPLGILAIIYLCNLFERSELIAMACVVFLAISFRVNTGEDLNTVHYVINRVMETIVGIVIAIVVNYYIKPPNPCKKLSSLNDSLMEFINKNVSDEGNVGKVLNLEEYRTTIHEFTNLLQLYHREVSNKKYELDIEIYIKRLSLFKGAYSHIFILSSINEDKYKEIREYHVRSLAKIKEKLTK